MNFYIDAGWAASRSTDERGRGIGDSKWDILLDQLAAGSPFLVTNLQDHPRYLLLELRDM